MLCDYGCGLEAQYTFKNGKNCCAEYSSKCLGMRKRNSEAVSAIRKKLGDSFWANGHPKGMTGKNPYNKGKTYTDIFGTVGAEQLKEKLAKSVQESSTNSWNNLPSQRKEQLRNKLRQNILDRYENGWEPKAGRCRKYTYRSPIAGEVKLDGTWELKVARWLDLKCFNWRRNKERFEYTNLQGKSAHYTPDFWIEEIGYLEVKGYRTKLDECKWRQFPQKLTIWYKDAIAKIEAELEG